MAASYNQTIKVVISGYYGAKNSGDEAVLRSILLALEEQASQQGVKVEPTVLSIDPDATQKLHNVKAIPRMQLSAIYKALKDADGLISGGGSLLQDATGVKSIPYYTGIIRLAQWLKKPTFIYAQGIGPVNRGWLSPFIKHAMQKSSYISLRDEQSAQYLQRIGVKRAIDVVPDPVMGMPLPEQINVPESSTSLPIIGISVRFWREDRADLKRVADALVQLSQKRDVCIRFLPFHLPDDIEASKFVMSYMQVGLSKDSKLELANIGEDPQQMLCAVNQCDVLFGMRLHALIYAANRKVPLLGLSYDPKIDQFLKRMNALPIGTTEQLDANTASDAVISLLDRKQAWLEHKLSHIEKLIENAQKPSQQIIASLRK